MNIEILLFDGFDELDALAPWEVFAGLAQVDARVSASLVTLEGPRPVRADHGATVQAQGALSERPDVLLVPGGGWLDRSSGTWEAVTTGAVPRAVAARHAAGTVVVSVCTGALVLAAAGILAGRRATTNPHALAELRGYPGVTVVPARLVDDGSVITGGAPACSLDVALHVVRRFAGPAIAEAAARELQYVLPEPEHVVT